MFLFCFSGAAIAQNRGAAFEMNDRLGRGINIGNTFEAPTETVWGNPWDFGYAKMIADLGFKHIRIPIRWDTPERTLMEPPYTISPSFLERIKNVIDTALAQGLHVVINMHHHNDIFDNPDETKPRFLAQWGQIADYFKEYPDSLLFEVLNEPNTNLTPVKWNDLFASALNTIRETNPSRMVLMGTAEWGGLGGIPHLVIPNDPNIIVTVHYYSPFPFTHQGASWVSNSNQWLGTVWRDSEAEREAITNEFASTLAFREAQNVPIHVGEFGAYSRADLQSRVKWTTFLARWFEEQNLSWAYWEFSSGFGIYKPSSNQFVPELVEALLSNPMPSPLGIVADTIYVSNFSTGYDGWSLSTSGGASATLTIDEGKLGVSIQNPGIDSWNVQLTRAGLSLEKNGMYRVSFMGSTTDARNTTSYVGMSSNPWTAYSGYTGFALTESHTKYTYTFTMSGETSTTARMVFDLGGSNAPFYLSGLTLERIRYEGEEETNIAWHMANNTVTLYPNPAGDYFIVSGSRGKYSISVFDAWGKRVLARILPSGIPVNIEHLPSGIYFVRISGFDTLTTVRLVKR